MQRFFLFTYIYICMCSCVCVSVSCVCSYQAPTHPLAPTVRRMRHGPVARPPASHSIHHICLCTCQKSMCSAFVD